MEIRKLKNSAGEILTTKDGKDLEELRFQVGDQFVPIFNSVLERQHDAVVKGKTKKITNYSIKCRARDNGKKAIIHNGEAEIFVALTPTQAKSLKQKVEDGMELNQNLFVAYSYDSKEHGPQIGLGLKKATKPAKTFDELDKEMTESIKEPQQEQNQKKQSSNPTQAPASLPKADAVESTNSADNIKSENKSTDDSEPIKIEEI